MTEPHDGDFSSNDLLVLATPYALHAMAQTELDDIERQLTSVPPPVAIAFADEVRAVRETMAKMSAATAQEPPSQLRERLLAAVGDEARVIEMRPQSTRWRTAALAAAAAVAIGLGAIGVGIAVRPEPKPSAAEQIFAAPDVRTVSGAIPTGGTATVVFSRERNAAVLVMNNVEPRRLALSTKCGWSARRVLSPRAPWTPPPSHRRPPRCCPTCTARRPSRSRWSPAAARPHRRPRPSPSFRSPDSQPLHGGGSHLGDDV